MQPPVTPLELLDKTQVRFRGKAYTYFGGCDYFRLARHPQVRAAAAAAARSAAIGTSASRLTTGTHRWHLALEQELVRFFGAQSAVVVSAGYLADLAVAQGLAGKVDVAFIDEKGHAALRDAAKFLECPVKTFGHRDSGDLKRKLRRCDAATRILIMTDGMFLAKGLLAPLNEYERLLPRKGWLLVDDAHGAGVLGEHGRGTPEHFGISRNRLIQTLTLSKAFGAFGGAILAPKEIYDAIYAGSRSFTGHSALPLPMTQAARAGIKLLSTRPGFRSRLRRNISLVKTALREAGVDSGEISSPVFTLSFPTPRDEKRLRRELILRGIYPTFISYPGGDTNGFFRFAISSEHSRKELANLTEAILAVQN